MHTLGISTHTTEIHQLWKKERASISYANEKHVLLKNNSPDSNCSTDLLKTGMPTKKEGARTQKVCGFRKACRSATYSVNTNSPFFGRCTKF